MAQSKEEKVHEVFQSISGSYDRMNAIISFQRHVSWRKDTMKLMKVEKGARALDVCCGTADWTLALAEAAGPEGEITGLDFSENMLEAGRKKVKEKNVRNISLVQGNAMELPFKDNSFDYVTIGFGLRNVPDFDHVIREMHRVVKPGGLVTCLETSQPSMLGFKQLYWLYFRRVMPIFGKMFAKSYQEYSWLQESAGTFPDKDSLADKFRTAGFSDVSYKSYAGGAAASHFARKPR
ncbi:bifunctional demethylmenaquinone methyltransferase/2-methoxy-6-polyprenyl-1,4-benzoquinol methylase UbiE [Alteribacter lacisalsi]|uniref:Demethylmenaquinone methyltransferase n=1 Tax=Alteribacter lacisalsi TaxID=2045244 RepID=A0A2W0HNH0_9BACI|nr:demethylmenaquinone methyltransferase [Alteribacter lacisalsi]PYZ98429.1 bifunctional demethylmenaquinone methyltransferase/2-methoxy-6-polyprenyl-1,4-benzoquinol methylase UbiE [Alteribacter lacisalsi]